MTNILLFLFNSETWFYTILFLMITSIMNWILAQFEDEIKETHNKKETKIDPIKPKEFNKFTALEKARFIRDKFYESPKGIYASSNSNNYNNRQSKEHELSVNISNIIEQINTNYPAISKKSNELADVVLTHVNVVCTDESLINGTPYSLSSNNIILIIEPLVKLLEGLKKLKNEEDIKIEKIKKMEQEEKKKLAEISRLQYNENMNEILKTIEYATKVKGE